MALANLKYFSDVWDDDSKSLAIRSLRDTFAALVASAELPILFYGSLLGCCRNGKIIAWDGDIDLCIDIDADIPTAQQILEEQGYIIYPPNRSPHYFRVLSPRGRPTSSDFTWPWVDVYHYRIKDNGEREFLEFLNVDGTVFYSCNTDEMFPLKFMKLEGLNIIGPFNPTIHLDRLYPGWQTIAESPVINHRNASVHEPCDQRIRIPIEELNCESIPARGV